jgi:hypothetical protein
MKLGPGDVGYEGLFNHWQVEGRPGNFDFQGKRWMRVFRDGKPVFIDKGGTAFDAGYAQNSFPAPRK